MRENMSLEEEPLQLAQKIKESFSGLRMPEKGAVADPAYPLEAPWVLEHYGGKRWADLPSNLDRLYAEDLCYMTPEGLRYYLPKFLLFLLSERGFEETIVLWQVLDLLRRWHLPKWKGRLPELTSAQRDAIWRWIDFQFHHVEDRAFEPRAEAALKSVYKMWRTQEKGHPLGRRSTEKTLPDSVLFGPVSVLTVDTFGGCC